MWLKGAAPPPRAGHETPPAASAEKLAGKKSAKEEDPDTSRIRFSFYSILEESEVLVPEAEIRPPAGSPASAGDSAPAQPARKPSTAPGSYKVQAGSFRHRAEAETRKAELALLGVHATIEPALFDGQAWYRVLAGPYDTPEKAGAVRQALARQGIETLVLRVTRR